MSPTFMRKDQEKTDAVPVWTRQVLEAELDRLNALSLPLLGTEVMTAAFGPGRDHDDDEVWVHGSVSHWGPRPGDIADAMMAARGFSSPLGFVVFGSLQSSPEKDVQQRILRLVAEALQVLEHALLVRACVGRQTSLARLALARGAKDRAPETKLDRPDFGCAGA